jgi:septal ring factor EnvC (AmiA/AmiB activator)
MRQIFLTGGTKVLSQTNDELELLIKQIAETRDGLRGFRRKTISGLSHDLDTVEQGVKSIEATGKRTKAAYKRYHTKLKEINTNILHLRAKRGAWYFRGARVCQVICGAPFNG